MKNTHKLLLGAALLTLSGTLAACGSGEANSDSNHNKVTLMQNTELLSLDNSSVADFTQWNTLENSMEGLYRQDKNNKLAPAMATKVVQPTNNGKTYTFHLRKNAKWSNGDDVTAQDFVKSWQRSVSDKSTSGYNYIFSGVKNADKISAGKADETALGVTAVDKHTLRVDLDHAMPYFNKMMILPAFFPQNTAAVKKYGSKYGTTSAKMVYNGPFKVTGWTGSNNSWKFLRNKHYYNQKAIHLKEIDMKVVQDPNTAHNMFTKGQLDDAQITGVTAQGLQTNKNLRHVTKAGTYYTRLNVAKNKTLSNKKLRRALNLVLDRKALTKKVLADGSEPAYTFVAKGLSTDPTTGKDFAEENQPAETHNVKKAKKLWAEGLKETGKSSVTLSLLGNQDTATKNVNQYIQSTVEENLDGAKVNVESLPKKALSSDVESGKFDMETLFWLADFGDPSNFLSINQSTNPQNYGSYNSKAFDTALTNAAKKDATNTKAYWADMRKAQQVMNSEVPLVPLYSMTESHLVNPKLKGVEYHPVGENDYTRAYLK